MPTFTVDTHLFRELGDLLVGRDSTALVELIKNAYDADATVVTVYGESLTDENRSFIRIADNGTGMSRVQFEKGFLRIASRLKDEGDRRSARFHRRYTGAKGVGRLAAHKLAREIEIQTVTKQGSLLKGLQATIDWDAVEKVQTLEDVEGTNAIRIEALSGRREGTVITLRRLRRRWSPAAHARFLTELQAFNPPLSLTAALPKHVLKKQLLFATAKVRDTRAAEGTQFRVDLEGELAPPDEYWTAAVDAADWVIEIVADRATKQVRYAISPTERTAEKMPFLSRSTFTIPHPTPDVGPFFQARVLTRVGGVKGRAGDMRAWMTRSTGVRVYVEGFRVLPYGESGNDWLSLDRDAGSRDRDVLIHRSAHDPLRELFGVENRDEDEGLKLQPNKHYLGAVFLTHEDAPDLRMLVNREGFIPEGSYLTLVSLVRGGIDLYTRVRAQATVIARTQQSGENADDAGRAKGPPNAGSTVTIRSRLARAMDAVTHARTALAAGDVRKAGTSMGNVLEEMQGFERIAAELADERRMLHVLASVGTQFAAFVHEVNGILGMAQAVERVIGQVRADTTLPRTAKRGVVEAHTAAQELRRQVERQAAYLVDVISPDASRRRSRQRLHERFARATRLVQLAADQREIVIDNKIPEDLETPPMFAAELTAVFSNLLTNAIKAAGAKGRVRASARRSARGELTCRVENTGIAVDLDDAERWFHPFASSTTRVDATLGQGMGLGLTITRHLLEEYGAQIAFVRPTGSFATAVAITFPAN
ncbi:MAG: ATP-binding protein [Gemmatimonadota bacterium]